MGARRGVAGGRRGAAGRGGARRGAAGRGGARRARLGGAASKHTEECTLEIVGAHTREE